MPAETGPSPPPQPLEVLRQRKHEMEERLQHKVNMSRLATYLMAHADKTDSDYYRHQKDLESGKRSGAQQHEVELVSDMSDISCSCSEWEAAEEEADDEADSRRSVAEESNTSSDMSNTQLIETPLSEFPLMSSTPNHKRTTTPAKRQSTPTTNMTTSSHSSLSNSDEEHAMPSFSDTPKKTKKTGVVVKSSTGGAKAAKCNKEVEEAVDSCEILKNKQFCDNDSTTLTESRAAYRMKAPLLALVMFLGALIVMLVVAVLVMTILTLCRKTQSHPLSTTTSTTTSIFSLAPQPPTLAPSLMPILQPTSQ